MIRLIKKQRMSFVHPGRILDGSIIEKVLKKMPPSSSLQNDCFQFRKMPFKEVITLQNQILSNWASLDSGAS